MKSIFCPDDALTKLLAVASDSDELGLDHIAALLDRYENDSRLHFLRGSLLANLQRYEEAQSAVKIAVELAPEFEIARFQLGFLELTSGDPVAAQMTWAPFLALPDDNVFHVFTVGLGHLVRDQLSAAVETLERGIALNHENLPLNANIQLIIDEARGKLDQDDQNADAEPISSTQALLQQFGRKPTPH